MTLTRKEAKQLADEIAKILGTKATRDAAWNCFDVERHEGRISVYWNSGILANLSDLTPSQALAIARILAGKQE